MSIVVVSGSGGRLGSRVAAHVDASADLTLVTLARKDVADDVLAAGQVLIECAPAGPALEHVALAAARGVPMVVASTGFDAAGEKAFDAAAEQVAVVVAPNLSLGVAVLRELVAQASRALAAFDVEVVEMHHRNKRDAPSGTAWSLARAAAEARGQDLDRDAILARAGQIGPRSAAEIGIQTLRGGDVIGEHTVLLVGETERVELTHRAASRDVFAAGALTAARFVAKAAPGRYGMKDVLGLGIR